MAIFRSTIWLGLLLALLCSLVSARPALSQESGISCLAAWSGENCSSGCTLASLAPKAIPCPDCHRHPWVPQPPDPRGQLLNPNKRLDQTSFVPLAGGADERGRRSPPPQFRPPQRPLLPNQTLAALSTVVLRN